jgi:acyl transferase domain-containing protein
MNNNGSKDLAHITDIAIIGMACVLPGAPDTRRYWENILHKVNAISDAPPEWEAELF